MSKTGRTWFALDIHFTVEDKILDAGERAGWLYLAMLGRIYGNGSHGVITRKQLATLGISGWERRMTELLRVGLVRQLDRDVYCLPAWQDWQGNAQRAAYMREWRAKKTAAPRLRVADQEDDQ